MMSAMSETPRRWLRVFYYGLLPEGAEIPVPGQDMHSHLAAPFGFTHLAHVTVTEAGREGTGPQPGGASDIAAAAAILHGDTNGPLPGLHLIFGMGGILHEAAAEWLENHHDDPRAASAARSVVEMEEQALGYYVDRIAATG